MDDAAPTTGQNADRAFRTGLIAVTAAIIGIIVQAVLVGILSIPKAVAAALLGYPVVLLVASCALGVWLGYDDEAKYRGAKYALEHTTPEDDQQN